MSARGDSLALAMDGLRGELVPHYGDPDTEDAMFEAVVTPNRSGDHSTAPHRSILDRRDDDDIGMQYI